MHITRTIHGTIAVFLFLAVVVGCGAPERGAVSGKVLLDGQPVDGGDISFIPLDGNNSLAAGGKITAGSYSIPAKKGPGFGKHRVEIRWVKKTGKILPPRGRIREPHEAVRHMIPARYHSQSKLTAQIEVGDNVKDFELQSK